MKPSPITTSLPVSVEKRPTGSSWRLLDSAVIGVLLAFRWLPVFVLSWFYSFFAVCFRFFGQTEYRRLVRNYSTINRLPVNSRTVHKFAWACVHHHIATSLETIKIAMGWPHARLDGLDQGQAILSELLKRHGRLVCITAHLGSWELTGMCAARILPVTFNALAKSQRFSWINRLIEYLRARLGIRVIWSDEKNVLRKMIKAMQAGEALGFVMDQKPEGRIGHAVEFLGHNAEFVLGPASMIKKFKAGVAGLYCIRKSPLHYEFCCHDLTDRCHQAPTEEAITSILVEDIETMICNFPEQWAWMYKRWTNLPT